MAHGTVVRVCNDHIEWVACADVAGIPTTVLVVYPVGCDGVVGAPVYIDPATGLVIPSGSVSNVTIGDGCGSASAARDVEHACAYVPGDDTQPIIPLFIVYTVSTLGVVTANYFDLNTGLPFAFPAGYQLSDDCQFDFELQTDCALVGGVKTNIVRTIARPRGISVPTVVGPWLIASTLAIIVPQPVAAQFVPCVSCGTIERELCVFEPSVSLTCADILDGVSTHTDTRFTTLTHIGVVGTVHTLQAQMISAIAAAQFSGGITLLNVFPQAYVILQLTPQGGVQPSGWTEYDNTADFSILGIGTPAWAGPFGVGAPFPTLYTIPTVPPAGVSAASTGWQAVGGTGFVQRVEMDVRFVRRHASPHPDPDAMGFGVFDTFSGNWANGAFDPTVSSLGPLLFIAPQFAYLQLGDLDVGGVFTFGMTLALPLPLSDIRPGIVMDDDDTGGDGVEPQYEVLAIRVFFLTQPPQIFTLPSAMFGPASLIGPGLVEFSIDTSINAIPGLTPPCNPPAFIPSVNVLTTLLNSFGPLDPMPIYTWVFNRHHFQLTSLVGEPCMIGRVTAIYLRDCTTQLPAAGVPPTFLQLDPTNGAMNAFVLGPTQTLGSCDPDLVNCDCNCPTP